MKYMLFRFECMYHVPMALCVQQNEGHFMYDMQIAKMMGILKECDEGGVMILESYVGRNI